MSYILSGVASPAATVNLASVSPLDDLGVDPATLTLGLKFAGPYLQKAWNEVSSWLTGESYDAQVDYLKAIAKYLVPDAVGKTPQEVLTAALIAGYVPLFTGEGSGRRDAIRNELSTLGWNTVPDQPVKIGTWWQRYAKGGGNYSHWYGLTYKLADAPAPLRERILKERCGKDPNVWMPEVVSFLYNSRGGGSTGPVDPWKNMPIEDRVKLMVISAPPPELCTPEAAATPASTRGSPPSPRRRPSQRPSLPRSRPEEKKWYQNPFVWVGIVGGLAAVGTVGYFVWRKATPRPLGDYCTEFLVPEEFRPWKGDWTRAECYASKIDAETHARQLKSSGYESRVAERAS